MRGRVPMGARPFPFACAPPRSPVMMEVCAGGAEVCCFDRSEGEEVPPLAADDAPRCANVCRRW